MKLEEINANRLKNSLNLCFDSLNYSTSRDLVYGNQLNIAFNCQSQKKLKDSLNTLIEKRYKDLCNLLNNYISMCDSIEKYGDLYYDTENLQEEYERLSRRQYYTETYTVETKDDSGKMISKKKKRTVKDYYVTRDMNRISEQISKNKLEMEQIESSIKSKLY